jgi:hypothetical protein
MRDANGCKNASPHWRWPNCQIQLAKNISSKSDIQPSSMAGLLRCYMLDAAPRRPPWLTELHGGGFTGWPFSTLMLVPPAKAAPKEVFDGHPHQQGLRRRVRVARPVMVWADTTGVGLPPDESTAAATGPRSRQVRPTRILAVHRRAALCCPDRSTAA